MVRFAVRVIMHSYIQALVLLIMQVELMRKMVSKGQLIIPYREVHT